MKKASKWLAIAAAGMVAASLGFVAACDGNPDSGKPDKDPPADTTPTITYQFTGNYTNETLTGYGFDYCVVLNLWSDGKVSGSSYNKLTMDDRAPADNSGFAEKWFRGSWSTDKNDEDIDYIKVKTIWDSDAISSMTGQALSGTYDYEVYFKADGTPVNFNLYCPIFGGGTQYPADMTGHKTPVYADNAAFIQGNLYTWTAPENIATFDTTAGGLTAKLFCQEDGKALFYTGKQVPGKQEYKYMPSATWSWEYSGGALKIKVDNSTEYTATLDGDAATFAHTQSVMGHDMVYNFSCSDISALKTAGGGTVVTPPEEEKEAIATLTATDGRTAEFYADGTAKIVLYAPSFVSNVKWEYSNGAFTFKEENGEVKTNLTLTVDGSNGTLVYTYSEQLNGTYTGDISALIPVETLATLTTEDGKTAEFFADGTATIVVYPGKFVVNVTWEYVDGAFIFKEKGEVKTNVTLTADGDNGTLVYQFGDGITYTGDISALIAE